MIFPSSIRGRLLLWIFLSFATLFILLGFYLHLKFQEVIFDSVDRTLHSKLQLVKGLMHGYDNNIEFEIDEIVLGEYVIPRSGHYYQILVDGKVAVASESLVDETFNLISGHLKTYDAYAHEGIYVSVGPDDEPIRVIRHEFKFLDKSVTILVAESMTETLGMISMITSYFFIVMPLMIILVGLIGFMIVSRSLKPLKVFAYSIEKITHKTLNERIESKGQVKELQGLALTFNSLLRRLQIAFESEKNLIADVAHELKTPLTVINAQCDISRLKIRSTEEYVESLAEIKTVSNSMLRQVNGMLTLARLDSGMLAASTFQQVPLLVCLEDAVSLIEPLAKTKNIRIHKAFRKEITIPGDKDTLTEAFLNLLENAVRYNLPNGSVDITMDCQEDQVVIVIKDTGIGIKEEETTRIFDRFYRAEASRTTKGTGLGLSITKAIIQAHNGIVSAENRVGQGSCFTIRLPLRREA